MTALFFTLKRLPLFTLKAAFILIALSFTTAAFALPSKIPNTLFSKAKLKGKIRVIIELDIPASLSKRSIDLREQHLQRSAIKKSQHNLLSKLHKKKPFKHRLFHHIPFLSLEVTHAELKGLESLNTVLSVSEDHKFHPTLDISIPTIDADLTQASGWSGQGQAIAILDTGIEKNHDFLQNKVVEEACFSVNGNCPNGSPTQLGIGAGIPCTYSSSCDHGTHVAGITAGTGSSFNGVAPEASLIAIQVFSMESGTACGTSTSPCALAYTSDIIAGLEHVLFLNANHQISAINLSLGGGKFTSQQLCDSDNVVLKQAIDNLRSVNIATIIASGNDGFTDALSSPGCISSAISVGAVDNSDIVASFSNSADFLSLLAPGVSISSSTLNNNFGSKSGTSMATPHVAGGWAVLNQFAPDQSIDTLLQAFKNNGATINDSRNNITKTRINVQQALSSLDSLHFERASYSCSGLATLTLHAHDLAGSASVLSNISSSSGDQETIALTESLNQQGVFSGIINLASSLTITGNNILEVKEGDNINATFNFLTENKPTISSVATIDCIPPIISNISIGITGASFSNISSTLSELGNTLIYYGNACNQLTQQSPISQLSLNPETIITALSPLTQYFFKIEATDIAGNISTDDNKGLCHSFTTTPLVDFFTEWFEQNDNNLDNQEWLFSPSEVSASQYTVCKTAISTLPDQLTTSNSLQLDDSAVQIGLINNKSFPFFNELFNSLFIGSNGYITFTEADTEFTSSLDSHFSIKRISALFTDLDPSINGTINWQQFEDRFVVSYENVPEYNTTNSNTLQIALYFDGRIKLSYLNIDALGGIAGLSPGNGLVLGFSESTFTEYPNCNCIYGLDTDGDGLTDCAEVQDYFTDPSNPDTDGDGLSDGIETGVDGFDSDPSTTTDPLNQDSDNDGYLDGYNGIDPCEDCNNNGAVDNNESNPSQEEHFITLNQGFQLFGYPAAIPPSINSCFKLYETLSPQQEINNITRFNQQTQTFERCNDLGGEDFTIQSGEAYIINSASSTLQILPADPACPALFMKPGINLISHPSPHSSLSCYNWLESMPVDSDLSLQRFNTNSGRYETCHQTVTDTTSNTNGIDFKITSDEGYILYTVESFSLPVSSCSFNSL